MPHWAGPPGYEVPVRIFQLASEGYVPFAPVKSSDQVSAKPALVGIARLRNASGAAVAKENSAVKVRNFIIDNLGLIKESVF